MNILISAIGRRGYIARYFREAVGRAGTIIGTSNTRWTPGFKDCDKTFRLPDIASDGYVDAVLDLCRAEAVDVILSAFDPDIQRLSGYRQMFINEGITPFLVTREVSEVCFDKARTSRFLTQHSFSHPLTFDTAKAAGEAVDAAELRFPVFVKPRFGFGSSNLFVARTPKELDVFFNYQPDMLIQERLEGDEFGLDILNDLNGNFVRAVVKRKVLMRSGETDQAEVVWSDPLHDLAMRLARTLGHVGPLDVDVISDGLTHRILEMNPRFGGGYPASHMAGADFPSLMIQMAHGIDLDLPLAPVTTGTVMMKELDAFDATGLLAGVSDFELPA